MHTGEFICFILFRKQNKVKNRCNHRIEGMGIELRGPNAVQRRVSEESKAFICSIVGHASVNSIRFKLLERTDNKYMKIV